MSSAGTLDAAALLSALLPTAALILLGRVLRIRFRYSETFWRDLERLAYFVLLPSLFVSGLVGADFSGLRVGSMVLVLALSSVLGAVVVWGVRRWVSPDDGPAFTSVFQGGIRFNNYIGLVVATALWGAEGLALAALCNAVLVPLVNVTSTITLARHGMGHGGPGAVVREVATNPLVLACLIGLGLHALGATAAGEGLVGTPVLGEVLLALGELLRILGGAALPIGLLCVGAGLRHPQGTRETAVLIGWSMSFRFLVVPAITAAIALALGLSGPAAMVAVLFQSIPTASSAYVLARRLGGDAPLMAAIIAVQTGVGLVTIPLWLYLGSLL